MAAIKNVFVMKSSRKANRWRPDESYITTEQLKVRNRETRKTQKSVGINPLETLEETIKDFKKMWPKVRLP